MSTFPHENPMCQCGVLLSRHNMEDDDHAFRLDLKAKWNRKPQCENCARALTRLMASRGKPGPAVGEMQHCPDCGDLRFLVHELVSITQETRLEAPVFMRERTTFTVPVGYEVPQCNCGRTPDYSHTEHTNGGAKFNVYQCGHGGPK